MMSALSFIPLLWSQAPMSGLPAPFRAVVGWLYVFSEPVRTITGFWGGPITWLKAVSLFSLIAWVVSWLTTALMKARAVGRASWLDLAALGALAASAGVVLLRVLETTQRIPVYKIGGVHLATLLGLACGAVLFCWVEASLWRSIRRQRSHADQLVLLAIQLGIIVGPVVGILYLKGMTPFFVSQGYPRPTWLDTLLISARTTATFMGYAVLLRVLGLVAREVLALRWRRIYSIALLTVTESTRRMCAPWVILTLFAVILAFMHWFLQAPRPAETGRLFVTTLTLVCSLLLTAMVTILTPLSLPYDIQNQTIDTVVSKPVLRIELIWGRMLGFMAIVSVLVVIFWGVGLAYLWRTVHGTIDATMALAEKEVQANRMTQANQYREQADQLRTRMAARVPIKGSLTFLDSRGTPHFKGIDVGQEQSLRQPRSHIEGATPATAIWTYGRNIPDPFNPRLRLDRGIPVDRLLEPATIEGILNQIYALGFQIENAERQRSDLKTSPSLGNQLTDTIARNRAELDTLNNAYQKLKAEADELEAQAKALPTDYAAESDRLRRQAARRHSPSIPMELTFNVYRTTKGKLGEPVYAELQATNPHTGAQYRNIIPIREYYTNKVSLPSSLLAGSLGALKVEVRCLSPTQYLGMAESDLYLLARPGNFGLNFFKGLLGVWLQAMVLTAIGVFAGTFLSWPVALLTTVAFFISGLLAIDSLLDFSHQTMLGGGPFESLIRLLSHDNQMSDLTPTLAVVTAKTLDALVLPFMSRLVYIVPNFKAFDVSNTVASGYNVDWFLMFENLLLAFAYALPFSIAGYFILKNREVAA